MNYNINYEDERFKEVENDKQVALDNINNQYNNMIDQSDKYYQDQANALEEYKNQQSQIQQENTDFAIEKIEQQKEQTEKDYTKEQKGAYVDWQKQTNQYGTNAEQIAASGLTNTGYSESSKVSMYNQYQGRVATARENYKQAILDYNNSIKEAQLANNSILAEIAFNTLQQKLELSLQGFQYKNSLLTEQLQQQQQIEDKYYSRWQDVLNQINQEKQFNESVRQFNVSNNYSSGNEYPSNPPYTPTTNISENTFGNDSTTINKKDYFFSNGYQPRYINNNKLLSFGVTVGEVFGNQFGSKISSQNIWRSADNKFYIWIGNGNKSGNYVDVTEYSTQIKNKFNLWNSAINIFK